MRTKRRTRGATLVEAVLGAVVMGIVIFGGILALLTTLTGWSRGQTRVTAEIQSQQALRYSIKQLREAMGAAVDVDGKGITYFLPAKDVSGNYDVPLIWDGVTRRIFLNNGGELVVTDGISTRVLLRYVVLEDPRGGTTAPYVPFTAGGGAITRVVTVHVVTKRTYYPNKTAWGRLRETVVLRNVPNAF